MSGFITPLFIFLMACSIPETRSRAQAGRTSPYPIGEIDVNFLREASGIAISRVDKNRLFHINDSGAAPSFVMTTHSGSNSRVIEIKGVKTTDTEDLGYGACGDENCLYIADTGDNDRDRIESQVILIRDQNKFPDVVEPVAVIRFQYPDAPHDCEAFAVHPNGDLFFLTKEFEKKSHSVKPSRVFRIEAAVVKKVLEDAKRGIKMKAPVSAMPWGSVDIPLLRPKSGPKGKAVTSFDIAQSGDRFLVLTYEDAFEFYFDPSKAPFRPSSVFKEDVDFRAFEIDILDKQEAATYLPDTSAFIYDSETPAIADFRKSVLLQVDLPKRP